MNLDLIQYNGISHETEEEVIDLSTFAGQKRFRKAMKQRKFCERMRVGEID